MTGTRDISKFFNKPQRRTLGRLGSAVVGMHEASIIVRKDGQDLWFEADWLRDVVPLLVQMVEESDD